MTMDAPLALRDIHPPVAPPWWPPAPGWWLLVSALLLAAGVWAWRAHGRRRHCARVAALFDEALARTRTAPEAVAAMSELLRRAARIRDPGADRLQGDAWLAVLDHGLEQPRFNTPEGRLLLDGAFRPDVAAADVETLRRVARARFIAWMTAR